MDLISFRLIKKTLLHLIFLLPFLPLPCHGNIINFNPELSISQEYTDNYFQAKDKENEFNTEYRLGFLFESLTKRSTTKLSYTPSYVDYNEFDENDNFRHLLGLDGIYNLTKKTDLSFSQSYSRSIDRTLRTGEWNEHDKLNTLIGAEHRFGKNDSTGLNLNYASDDFENPNSDDFETIKTSGFFNYWFSVKYGLNSGLSYEKTEFDTLDNDKTTIAGNLKLIKKFTKHFSIYGGYSHSYSDDDIRQHILYNPNAGFDWRTSEDSGVSMGIGLLINNYDNQDDSRDLFVNADIFKNFNFSKRGSFALTASSGYEETSEEAASLGFNIYYKAGFSYSYRLTRKADFQLTGSYKNQRFEEEISQRKDNTLDLATSLDWSVLRWMELRFSYSYRNFDTDSEQRENYNENRGTISIRLAPDKPSRIKSSNTRGEIESIIYNRD